MSLHLLKLSFFFQVVFLCRETTILVIDIWEDNLAMSITVKMHAYYGPAIPSHQLWRNVDIVSL